MWRALLCVGLGSLAFAAEPDAKAVKDELAKLEGVWQVVEGEGVEAKLQFHIQGTRWFPTLETRFGVRRRDEAFFVTIDPTKTPKEINLLLGREQVAGIYQLDGDALQIQASEKYDPKENEPMPKRPAKFDPKAKEGYMKLKRVSPLPERGPHKDVAPLVVWSDRIITAKLPKFPLAGVLPHTNKNSEAGYINNQKDLAELWRLLALNGKAFGGDHPKIDFREATVVVLIRGSADVRIHSEPEAPHWRLEFDERKVAFKEEEPTSGVIVAVFPKASIDAVLKANKK